MRIIHKPDGDEQILADTLRQMIELIEAHEVTCFSCDRDGELYCDCLKRMVKDAKAKLSANSEGAK